MRWLRFVDRAGHHRGRARAGRRRGAPGAAAGRRLDQPRRDHVRELHQRLQEHRHADVAAQQPGRDAVGTVVVSVVVAAPAGYVLSRGRGRTVSGYSLLLFVVQSLPVITAVIPLFILFAKLHLVDSLIGLAHHLRRRVDVGRHLDDGGLHGLDPAQPRGGGVDRRRVGLRRRSSGSCCATRCRASCRPRSSPTSCPGTTTWWRSFSSAPRPSSPCPLGVESFFQQNVTDWGSVMAVAVVMMAPPVLVFAVLNRYFSVGGIGGSLAGQ